MKIFVIFRDITEDYHTGNYQVIKFFTTYHKAVKYLEDNGYKIKDEHCKFEDLLSWLDDGGNEYHIEEHIVE